MKNAYNKLTIDFYDRDDVVIIAKELIGKIILTQFNGVFTGGRIVETEAYVGITDKASHSFNGKRTTRNEHMYAEPGTSYIYICYGMHQMINIVTNKKNIPDAILLRAIEPLHGEMEMAKRSGKTILDVTLTKGPGNVGRALGLQKMHSGITLLEGETIQLFDDGHIISNEAIGSSKRIGVESAGKDGLLPYRFFLKGNKYVSGRPNK